MVRTVKQPAAASTHSENQLNTMKAPSYPKTLLLTSSMIAIFCAQSEAATIIASDNAFVRNNANATIDQDESEVLLVKSNGSNINSRLTYLRFDVTALSGYVAGTDASLSLQLIAGVLSDTFYLYAVNDGVATETSWNSSLTWNARPDGTGNLAVATGNANTSSLLASFSYDGTPGISMTFDLKDKLAGLLAADTNGELTFVISSVSENTSFASLTNTGGDGPGGTAPYPVPTLYTIPEPSSFALLGFGLLGILVRRSR